MFWIILAAILLVIGAIILWWLLIKTEGIYLGRKTVIWLYDLYASRYDNIKQYDPYNEDYYLARPILQRIPHLRAPLVLDVATGTGRLPLALLEQPTFQGRIVALDLSRKMLGIAAEKLAPFSGRVSLLHHPAEALPFPDNTFDLVTCLEALEFMMNPPAVLREIVRVLRPGGLLVITNRQGRDAKLMPGRALSHTALKRLLANGLRMESVELQPWQVDYRLVWARKSGQSLPAGPLGLESIWRCPHCGTINLIPVEAGWRCLTCETQIALGADGVIEAQKL
jgi:ubiquinone/menaquinone biosynthesis C-methylase UbiE